MSLHVVKYGTRVKTVIGNIEAIITAICIRQNDSVCYEISYFNHGISTVVWVTRIEFEVFNVSEKQKAGLVNYDITEDDESKTQILLS